MALFSNKFKNLHMNKLYDSSLSNVRLGYKHLIGILFLCLSRQCLWENEFLDFSFGLMKWRFD